MHTRDPLALASLACADQAFAAPTEPTEVHSSSVISGLTQGCYSGRLRRL